MGDTFNVQGGPIPPEMIDNSDTVQVAAMARFPTWSDYGADPVARHAYIDGFRAGGRWALRVSAQLSDPRFREAIAAIHALTKDAEP